MNIKQIRSKQAFILNGNIGVSYETPIAASINGVSFITENYYSNTTAHHKSDVLREFNNSYIIEVKQETINQFHQYLTYGYYTAAAELAEAVIFEEEKIKRKIIAALETGKNEGVFFKDKSLYEYIEKSTRQKETYKNGNTKTVQHYKSVFNYVSDIYFKETIRAIKTRLKTGNSKPGKANAGAIFYKYKYRVVIYSY